MRRVKIPWSIASRQRLCCLLFLMGRPSSLLLGASRTSHTGFGSIPGSLGRVPPKPRWRRLLPGCDDGGEIEGDGQAMAAFEKRREVLLRRRFCGVRRNFVGPRECTVGRPIRCRKEPRCFQHSRVEPDQWQKESFCMAGPATEEGSYDRESVGQIWRRACQAERENRPSCGSPTL